MKPGHHSVILIALLLGLTIHLSSSAQEAKRGAVRGSDIPHPLYWPLEKKAAVEAIGDSSSRPAIVYIVRLEAGQQLTATLTSRYDKSWLPEPFVLYFFDSKTTSLIGSGTTFLVRQPAQPYTEKDPSSGSAKGKQPPKEPSAFVAKFAFVSPVSADYYVVPTFENAGIFFKLAGDTKVVMEVIPPASCASGPVSKPVYISPGTDDSLISDITIGDPDKTAKPDNQNRRFCLKGACAVRPPTSLVLTYKLQEASDSKKSVKVCWDSSKTITEVEQIK